MVHSLIKRRIVDRDTVVICTGDMGGADGTPCYLHCRVVDTAIGRLGGVSGIVARPGRSPEPRAHIYAEDAYGRMLSRVLDQQPATLLTHTPYALPTTVPRHLFGHAHFDAYIGEDEGGGLLLNMDGRIFVWE